jgi:hypothetical protein
VSVQIVLEHEVTIGQGEMKDIEKTFFCRSSEVYQKGVQNCQNFQIITWFGTKSNRARIVEV